MISKTNIRNIVFERRKNFGSYLSIEEQFFKYFLTIDYLKNMRDEIVAGYYPMDFECNILKMLNFYSNNNTIVLPKILEKNKPMLFKKWNCKILILLCYLCRDIKLVYYYFSYI